jgi:hypothetical protein
VANTLTVFAIRDVGLTIAFPLWNTNSLVGMLWGRLLFGELKGASGRNVAKVLVGALAIVAAAVMLGFSTMHGDSGAHGRTGAERSAGGAGASLMWGTMYIPYRKAYISGMNPLSFVTVFTIGELGTCFALVLALDGGTKAERISFGGDQAFALFWLFLGGFVWVIGRFVPAVRDQVPGDWEGDSALEYQPALGIGVGCAGVWGVGARECRAHRLLVVAGSVVMILGALAVSTAVASERENASTKQALERECLRYGLDHARVIGAYSGAEGKTVGARRVRIRVVGGTMRFWPRRRVCLFI